MAETVDCFMVKKTGRIARWLRRYSSIHNCNHGDYAPTYHNGLMRIEDAPEDTKQTAEDFLKDPRWPRHCVCGYNFIPEDVRQLFHLKLYSTPDGRSCVLHPYPMPGAEILPAGAMFFSDWSAGRRLRPGPYLYVVLPNGAGTWCIDGPSDKGDGWIRTGEPPLITVTPSIDAGKYHGVLTDGKLVKCG